MWNKAVFILFVIFNGAISVCPGKPNTYPINENDLHLINQVTNGKLYQTKNIDPPISVIHIYGTPYEMGLAHGQLLKPLVNSIVTEVFQYLENQGDQYLQFLPEWLRKIVEQEGFMAVLELTYYATRDYTSPYFFDELKGIADGSGVDYQTLVNIHMLPELIQAACSIVGSWGTAISNTNGTLYQLRALDWCVDGPFQKWPAVIVYHPQPSNGHPFAILTFAGFIGALTGYSSVPIGISQKVWVSYNGTDNRVGYPWHFLLRDILQFDNTMDDALSRIINAHRTCSIHIGIGDPTHTHTFRIVEYSYDYIQIYNDLNYPEYQGHPRMNDLIYINKYVQPSRDPCLGDLLKAGYGSIDGNYLRNVAALHQTGDTHVAVYDYANNLMYVAIASPWINGTFTPAYDRRWTKLDLTSLFNEQ